MNQTIYFRKEVWEHLKDEEKKSDLINNLLVLHYNTTQHKTKTMKEYDAELEEVEEEFHKDVAEKKISKDWSGPLYRNKKEKKL